MNNKGVSLAELIVSFAIVCVAVIYMFRMVISVKEIYSTAKKETNEYISEAYIIKLADKCIDVNNGALPSQLTEKCGKFLSSVERPKYKAADGTEKESNEKIYKITTKDGYIFYKYIRGHEGEMDEYEWQNIVLFKKAQKFIIEKDGYDVLINTTCDEGTIEGISCYKDPDGLRIYTQPLNDKYSGDSYGYVDNNWLLLNEECADTGSCSSRFMLVIKDETGKLCFQLMQQDKNQKNYHKTIQSCINKIDEDIDSIEYIP